MDRALDQLKAEGYPLAEEDIARLSPFVRQDINVIGTYSFAQPDLGPAGVRKLRNPEEPDWEGDVLSTPDHRKRLTLRPSVPAEPMSSCTLGLSRTGYSGVWRQGPLLLPEGADSRRRAVLRPP